MTIRSPGGALLAASLLLAIPAPGPGQTPVPHLPPEGITLDEILVQAAERNPGLLAMRELALARAAVQPEASTLPDPVFQIGAMNLGLPDLNGDMPTSMAPAVQVMQMVPFPGKLGLAGRVAGYGTQMATASAAEEWWTVRREASAMFYDLYALDRQIEVMRSTLSLLVDFEDVARSMYQSGMGRQADVLRANVEVARMDGEIRKMEAMRIAMAARLNGLLDRDAETPVPSPLLGSLPVDLPDRVTLLGWAEEDRPALERARLGVARSRSQLDLARKEIWPDLTVGFQYGQRDRGEGVERMGSAMIGFSLPIHAGSRQHAMREEARAMGRMADAELAGVRAGVDSRIRELLAELDRARNLVALYRDEVLPQARASVESSLSSYRVGAVDFMTLVDAEMTVNRYEAELFVLLADYAKALRALESEVGREMPLTSRTLAEES